MLQETTAAPVTGGNNAEALTQMGFANLMMLPLRIEYLANPKYSLALQPASIAFLTGVVPNVARLVMSPVWGWLFDRANFSTPSGSITAGNDANGRPLFGQSASLLANINAPSRQAEFAIRYQF